MSTLGAGLPQAVVQEEIAGCGIASVAALAGVTYEQARAAAAELGISAADPELWSQTGHVRRLLAHFGLHAAPGEMAFRSWAELPATALLATKWHLERGRPFWHWAVFVRGPDRPVVLDSKPALKTNVRTDFGRIKPKWFIAVSPP